MSNKYVFICYICIFMCMGDIKYCSYIYIVNVNIVYSCKLYFVMIICGYDFSFYIFEEISEKKIVMYFY